MAELDGRLSRVHLKKTNHSPALAISFIGVLLVQGAHEIELVFRVVQHAVLDIPEAKGLLGQFFELEPLHLAYNLPFLLLLLLVYRLSGAHRPDLWTRGMTAWWLLNIAVFIQCYHVAEHLFKIGQFIDTGRDGTPGILGNAFDLIWLHFALNTVAYLPAAAAFWVGGFQRHLGADLRAAWAELGGRSTAGEGSVGSPLLSRRTLLIGAAAMAGAGAIGAARLSVALRRPDIELPEFADVTTAAGITFRHQAHDRADAVQAGAAFLDFNGNGLPDIFFTNASGPNAMYRNNGNGTFTDVAAEAGLADPDGIAVGVACADYDNDGHCDLLVTTMTGLKLFHNNGDGTFTNETEKARLLVKGGHPASAAWADFDNDGNLDLYVSYWIDQMPPDYYTPDAQGRFYKAVAREHRLFRNNGNGVFSDATEFLGPDRKHGAGLVVGFLDYNDDGRPDIYVVNDFGQYVRPNILFRNEGPGESGWNFTDVSFPAGVDAGFHGMGLAVGDYDGDGRLDMYVTNWGDNVLYRNLGDGTFDETTNRAWVGRGVVRGEKSVGWGAGFLDFDNDGLLDLYFVAGTIYPEKNSDGRYPPDQPNALFHNPGDRSFRDVSRITGTDHTGCARGFAMADIDGDGFLDLLVTNIDQRPALLRNSGNGNRWLQVKLVGTRSNRDGIGSRLTLTAGGKRQIREIFSGTSFLSQHSLSANFGLGQLDRVDELEIRWPSGVVQTLADLQVNQRITVSEAT